MTSVTVAGGSFDRPGAAKGRLGAARAGRDRWLRYGIGVSIAGLLTADAVVLAAMAPWDTRNGADGVRRPPAAAARPVAGREPGSGDGFATLDVPADGAAFLASAAASGALADPAGSALGSAAARSSFAEPGQGGLAPLQAPPATRGDTGSPVAGPSSPDAPSEPPATDDPTVVDALVAVIEQAPVVGDVVAGVAEDAGPAPQSTPAAAPPSSAATDAVTAATGVEPQVDSLL